MSQAGGEIITQPGLGSAALQQVPQQFVDKEIHAAAVFRRQQGVEFAIRQGLKAAADGGGQLFLKGGAGQIAVHTLAQLMFQSVDPNLEIGLEAPGNDHWQGTEILLEELLHSAVHQGGQVLLKRLFGDGGADVFAGQEAPPHHLADVLGQGVTLGGNDAGSHGRPDAEKVPGLQGPEKHADGYLVGQIADKGADARMRQGVEQGRIKGKHDV